MWLTTFWVAVLSACRWRGTSTSFTTHCTNVNRAMIARLNISRRRRLHSEVVVTRRTTCFSLQVWTTLTSALDLASAGTPWRRRRSSLITTRPKKSKTSIRKTTQVLCCCCFWISIAITDISLKAEMPLSKMSISKTGFPCCCGKFKSIWNSVFHT